MSWHYSIRAHWIILFLICISIKALGAKEVNTSGHEHLIAKTRAVKVCQENTAIATTNENGLISYLSGLTNTSDFPARWNCGTWSLFEGWFMIISDFSIFTAYLSIPLLLVFILIRKKQDIRPFKKFFILFAAFILLCGFTHFIDAIIFWEPIYRISGLVKFLTGVVSWITVIAVSQAVPMALTFKSPAVLEKEITKRKQLQQQLGLFVKYTPAAVAMFDKDLRYLVASDRWYEDYGLSGTDIIGKEHYQVFPEILNMPEWIDFHQRALKGEALKREEDPFVRPNGKTDYISWEIHPWYTPENEIGGIIMFTRVVTELVHLNKELIQSNETLETALQGANAGIFDYHPDEEIHVWDRRAASILGLEDPLRLTHKEFMQMVHSEDHKFFRNLSKKPPSKIDFQFRISDKEGQMHYINSKGSLIKEPGSNVKRVVGVNFDITESILLQQEKEKEHEALNKTRRLLNEVTKIANVGAWQVDIARQQVYWNDITYQIYELDPETPVKLEDGINFCHPDHQPTIQKAIEKAIEDKIPWDLELKIITVKRKEVWVRSIGQPIVENGKLISLQGLVQDIDKKKRYELSIQKNKERLEQEVYLRTEELSKLNKELEAFTYSVSHDLRAPLRAINGYAEALKEELDGPLTQSDAQYLERIIHNSKKMGHLIDDLLAFSKLTRENSIRTQFSASELIGEIIDFNEEFKHIQVSFDSLPALYGDMKMLEQVFLNLMSNAVKYSSKKEDPEIHIYGAENSKETSIIIKDNGSGFDMRYADKLFEVFQRLHSDTEFEGTGVGLALCKKIIDKHDGRIEFESEINKGSRFTVILPKNS